MKNILVILLVFSTIDLFAQDMIYVNKLVKQLSSEKYKGRGYIGKGDSIAAQFIRNEFKKFKLDSISDNYYQNYKVNINTFEATPKLKIEGKKLKPSYDYIVNPASCSGKGKYKLIFINNKQLNNIDQINKLINKSGEKTFVVFDAKDLKKNKISIHQLLKNNKIKPAGIIRIVDNLKFSARTFTYKIPCFDVLRNKIRKKSKHIKIYIENKFIKNYKTQNVISYIPGKKDSTIIFAAHYDHLGFLGKNMYPGALDNATGIAMVLELAKYFKQNNSKPKYNLAFILFSGEEAGLLGSTYYVNHPLFSHNKTIMVFNFDMVGTGNTGVSFFGMKDFPKDNELLFKLNKENNYIKELKVSEKIRSSDQYPFYKYNVNAVHVYSHGEEDHYHKPTDTPETVGYYEFKNIFKLVVAYTNNKLTK